MTPPNGYGTAAVTAAVESGDNIRTGTHGNEGQPLLGASMRKSSRRKNMMVNVHRDWADLVLLMCYALTGLLDSISISTWGTFVSMQTGNTVYLGLGLAAPHESKRWIKSGVSLGSFCIGSFCFSRFHRHFMPRRRWVLCASFLAQMVILMVAAAVMTWGPASVYQSRDIDWHVLLPIALIAFQGCGQAVVSRALKYNNLNSVVLTSIYCDLFSDAELFVVNNAERNRRVAAPVLLFIGALIGGLLVHSPIGAAGVIWVAGGLKLLIALAWCFWKADEDDCEI